MTPRLLSLLDSRLWRDCVWSETYTVDCVECEIECKREDVCVQISHALGQDGWAFVGSKSECGYSCFVFERKSDSYHEVLTLKRKL